MNGIRSAARDVVTFYRAIPDCRAPMRADPSGLGTLPARGFQYCEALRCASAFGWYVFAPLELSLQWDGADVVWTYRGARDWYPLGSAQYPGYARLFDRVAPRHLRGCSPPLLTAVPGHGIVQVWTGFFMESAPDWSVLVRAPANLPRNSGFDLYEGVVESDRWFGPLFTNIRLAKTDVPIHFSTETPLVQVQPLHRSTYADEVSNAFRVIGHPGDMPAQAWSRYEETIVKPRPVAAYAAAVRRRRKGACPVARGEAAEVTQ